MIARTALAILIAAAAPAFSQAVPVSKSTVTAAMPTPDDRARQWLILVDDKNYTQSWSQAGKTFQNKQKADVWATEAGDKRGGSYPRHMVALAAFKVLHLPRWHPD